MANSNDPLKAYQDVDFLNHDVCRPIRLQLELLKPETTLAEQGISSTIVLFGSARIPDPETARKKLVEVNAALNAAADSETLQFKAKVAQRMLEQSHYYQVARDFAALLSSRCQVDGKCDYVVITGGGGGMMQAGNQGAADVGAKSIGLNISLPFEQHPNPYITPELSFIFHYFSIRKMHFLLRAKALCAFPGGFGTMDELFEALTLIQTRKIKQIPVLLFGREFWEEMINWQAFVDRGLICPGDLDMFTYCETAEEGWDIISKHWNIG